MNVEKFGTIISSGSITMRNITFDTIDFQNQFRQDFFVITFYFFGGLAIDNLTYKNMIISQATLLLLNNQNVHVIASGITFENITASESSSFLKLTKTSGTTISLLNFID